MAIRPSTYLTQSRIVIQSTNFSTSQDVVKIFVVNAESNQNLKSYNLNSKSGKVLVLASGMFYIMC